MASINALTAGIVILAFIAGTGAGYLLTARNEAPTAGAEGTCPAEVTPLNILTVALNDPKVIGLLGNKSIAAIAFSRGTYSEQDMNYTQIVFRLQDPDPDDHMTASMIVVQINDSCKVYSVYETYPSYIPKIVPET